MPPEVSGEFAWRAAPWGLVLQCRALGSVAHGWTTRQLQLRGTPEAERAGWAAIGDAVGLSPGKLVRLAQVHGSAVHVADSRPCGTPEADIVLSDAGDRVVAVQVADCAPILTADGSGRVIAASLAGWRGTAADVAGVTVRALADRYQAEPDTISAAVGPCIGPCCYEVGEELVDAFRATGWSEVDCERWFVWRDGTLFLDIWRANADQLERAGVPAKRIFLSRLCTACHPDYFHSYRRDGAGTGRLAGYIRARSG
jgi:polyphenol oxidase